LWLSRRTPVVSDAPWSAQAQQLAAGLGLSRVRFLRTGASTMPMAWGIFRSSVLMPAEADTWPAHRLRVVLLHELAHVKRRDCVTHLVAQIACAAYWFNPLVWMAARRLRTERERACAEADRVVSRPGRRRQPPQRATAGRDPGPGAGSAPGPAAGRHPGRTAGCRQRRPARRRR